MNEVCLICKSAVPPYSWNPPEGAHIKCDLCGEYRISERLATQIGSGLLHESYIYSGAIRENHERGIVRWINDLKELRDSVVIPANPFESIDRVLLYVLGKMKSADDGLELTQSDRSVAYAKTPEEFSYFLAKARDLGYIEKPQGQTRERLTLEGWKHLSQLPQREIRPSQAFVAMWFDKSLDDAWEYGLRPALKETGYDPIRIDRTEHNEKIDDRIVAEIRKSGLLVADFTGQRAGVYFEAGFAMGLGIPVIWTCKNTDLRNLHFDTRQYNHIDWADAADLKKRLVNRIEATLPFRQKVHVKGFG